MKSPCINICRLNEKGVCTGCKRTETQIIHWDSYSDAKRKQIMETLDEYK